MAKDKAAHTHYSDSTVLGLSSYTTLYNSSYTMQYPAKHGTLICGIVLLIKLKSNTPPLKYHPKYLTLVNENHRAHFFPVSVISNDFDCRSPRN